MCCGNKAIENRAVLPEAIDSELIKGMLFLILMCT